MKKNMDKLTWRNIKARHWRKLVDLRNEFYLNQINTLEFIRRLEIILFNTPKPGVKMAGDHSGAAAYTTIAQRLLKAEIGEVDALENLKTDFTYYYVHDIKYLDFWEIDLPNHKW